MNRSDRIYVPPPRRLGLDPLPHKGWRILSAILFVGAIVTGLIWWRLT